MARAPPHVGQAETGAKWSRHFESGAMTYAICTPHDFTLGDRGRSPWKVSAIVLGAVALTCCALVGAWLLPPRLNISNFGQASVTAPEVAVVSKPYIASLRPAFPLEFTPAPSAQIAQLGPNVEPIRPALRPAIAEPDNMLSITAPAIRRPTESAPPRTLRLPKIQLSVRRGTPPASQSGTTQQTSTTALPTTSPDIRTFLEKLFGMREPTGPALAYAAPEDRALGDTQSLTSGRPLPYDNWTAVYDIAAHTVYLPNGARLEAHSGLGEMLDDPRYVGERDRGATPPHVYDLQLRAQPFHGVQAVRLIPIGSGAIFGRSGFLAHPYMLGPNGDSNGCVSVKDYDAFLRAFLNGEVRHLAVVASLN
jgi:hypothetical protein